MTHLSFKYKKCKVFQNLLSSCGPLVNHPFCIKAAHRIYSEEYGTGYWITRLKYRSKYSLIKVQQQGFNLSCLIDSGLKKDQRGGNGGVKVLLSNGGDWRN